MFTFSVSVLRLKILIIMASLTNVCRKGYDFSGIYVPITTPFNDDESIAWEKLESNIKKMNASNVKGFVVQGSTGEFCYLSAEEKVNTVKKVDTYLSLI